MAPPPSAGASEKYSVHSIRFSRFGAVGRPTRKEILYTAARRSSRGFLGNFSEGPRARRRGRPSPGGAPAPSEAGSILYPAAGPAARRAGASPRNLDKRRGPGGAPSLPPGAPRPRGGAGAGVRRGRTITIQIQKRESAIDADAEQMSAENALEAPRSRMRRTISVAREEVDRTN